MRLSLHVISRAGFGVHLEWPGKEKAHEESQKIRHGHTMTYTDALGTLLHLLLLVLLVPRVVLSKSISNLLRH